MRINYVGRRTAIAMGFIALAAAAMFLLSGCTFESAERAHGKCETEGIKTMRDEFAQFTSVRAQEFMDACMRGRGFKRIKCTLPSEISSQSALCYELSSWF